ncbi:Coatomer subunit alpha [Orchesella cincta]|uniref:Coatomer subunit alpha n=1 Tax=Orchesella cincta TaxID=48709 RepID=A0A1D2M8U1_ORCCI|nr:Coatomer subunit alpha [Orchesella cincta]
MIQWMDADPTGGWGDEDLPAERHSQGDGEATLAAGGGWDMEDDIELSPDLQVSGTVEVVFEQSLKGISVPQRWTNSSKYAIDHVYAGSFESTARLLYDQIGVVSIEPFRQLFLAAYLKSRASFTALPNLPALPFYPMRNTKEAAPAVGNPLSDLVQKLQGCFQLTTKGDFPEAVDKFQSLLLSIPLTFVENKSDLTFIQELVILCREYILGLQMELYRLKKNPVDEHAMEYDEQNPFSVCAVTYKPIYRGKPEVKCPFCRATFMPQFEGSLCVVCTVAEVGKEDVLGLRISPIQFR